jgi:hypothetical protein
MRQKPANEYALNNLIDFLNDIFLGCEANLKNDIKQSINHFKVAKRTFSDLKALEIVKVDPNDKEKIIWIANKQQPMRITALKILDYRLNKTKKTIHFPIPDFAAIGDSLKEISERLMQITVQHERALKTTKNIQGETQAINPTIFTEQQQRFELVKAISAGGIFNTFANLNDYQAVGHRIVTVADHLIELLNKPKP